VEVPWAPVSQGSRRGQALDGSEEEPQRTRRNTEEGIWFRHRPFAPFPPPSVVPSNDRRIRRIDVLHPTPLSTGSETSSARRSVDRSRKEEDRVRKARDRIRKARDRPRGLPSPSAPLLRPHPEHVGGGALAREVRPVGFAVHRRVGVLAGE